MLARESDHEVGGADVGRAKLAAAMARRRHLESGERLAGTPAHRHALDHVRAGGRDLDVSQGTARIAPAITERAALPVQRNTTWAARRSSRPPAGDGLVHDPGRRLHHVGAGDAERLEVVMDLGHALEQRDECAAAAIGEISALTRPSACDSVTVVAR